VARPPLRRIVLALITIVVAATCIRLGFWQLGRLHGREAINVRIAAGFAAAPRPLPDLLAGTSDPATLAFRRTEARGTYDPSHEVIFYGRNSTEGLAGNQVLTPLVLDDGTALLVDRGWVPADAVTPPVEGEAAAPTGVVDVSGVLFPPDLTTPAPPSASPQTLVRQVDLVSLGDQMPYRLLPVYLLLQSQDPPQQGDLPQPPPLPELTNGPHASYAFQWFSFATIALVGYVVLSRRDRRDRPPAEGSASDVEGDA
jgi:cytochrome oxidase assembly protein ShyY1